MDLTLWLACALFLSLLTIALLARGWQRARAALRDVKYAKQSQSTRYGQITEQFAPFLADWPWDPKGFRFIGTPIDGIQFTQDGVFLVEIKSAGSRLSSVQRTVRDHVQAGRVAWHEVRIS